VSFGEVINQELVRKWILGIHRIGMGKSGQRVKTRSMKTPLSMKIQLIRRLLRNHGNVGS
jgi:hypothetical protein